MFSSSVHNKLAGITASFTKTISDLQELIDSAQKEANDKGEKIQKLSEEKQAVLDTQAKAATFKANLENLFK